MLHTLIPTFVGALLSIGVVAWKHPKTAMSGIIMVSATMFVTYSMHYGIKYAIDSSSGERS